MTLCGPRAEVVVVVVVVVSSTRYDCTIRLYSIQIIHTTEHAEAWGKGGEVEREKEREVERGRER